MKKFLALAVSLCVIATAVIGTTYAYRTARTGDVQNTFSFDSIKITLTEEYEQGSVFYPGVKIDKKATVTVEQDNSPCYLYAMVENQFGEMAAPNLDETRWIPVPQAADDNKAVYRYHEIVKRGDADQPFTVFENVTFSDDLTQENIGGYAEKTITVGAFAHQASGVDVETADAGAVAYFTQPAEG